MAALASTGQLLLLPTLRLRLHPSCLLISPPGGCSILDSHVNSEQSESVALLACICIHSRRRNYVAIIRSLFVVLWKQLCEVVVPVLSCIKQFVLLLRGSSHQVGPPGGNCIVVGENVGGTALCQDSQKPHGTHTRQGFYLTTQRAVACTQLGIAHAVDAAAHASLRETLEPVRPAEMDEWLIVRMQRKKRKCIGVRRWTVCDETQETAVQHRC